MDRFRLGQQSHRFLSLNAFLCFAVSFRAVGTGLLVCKRWKKSKSSSQSIETTSYCETYRSAATVNRITWASVNVGVNWIELVGVDATPDAPSALPIFDDMLPSVLNVVPMLAVPVIEDGLYVGIEWNGLRDCVTGSGLNSALDVSILDNGTWNEAGLLTHSANAFWNRRTCNGFDAIPTSAIISRNSSSPASQSCWTSSPPFDRKFCFNWKFNDWKEFFF